MENYCPKCGSRVTFNEKNNKYTCSSCGHTFYEKNIYLDRKKVNENYYHKKTPLTPSKSQTSVIFIVIGIAVALFVILNVISRYTVYKDYKVKMIGDYVDIIELRNKNKEELVIPSTVAKISSEALSFSNAKTIILEHGVRKLDSNALASCKNLTDITIPSSLKYIGYNVFKNDEKLTNVYYNGTIEDWCKIYFYSKSKQVGCARRDPSTDYGYASPMDYASNFYILDKDGDVSYNGRTYSLLTDLVIPSSVNALNNHQFSGFDCLKTVSIPSSVINIGISTFQGCSNLESVTINAKIKRIPINMFRNCASLKSVTFKDEVDEVEEFAFYNCSSLKEFYFQNIHYIERCAFSNTGFESLDFENKDIVISNSAFSNSKCLTSVKLGIGTNYISDSLFSDCINLTYVLIPKEVKFIQYRAFYNCESLTEINYEGTIDNFRYLVSLDRDWNKNSRINNVKCSDGDYEVLLDIDSQE
ncbi:MAG: leucine-rich repeat protein [Gammaproteobacteria bacterium]|nr:leucine-rich repeat protein [Gammaproteobacteria bacterium]